MVIPVIHFSPSLFNHHYIAIIIHHPHSPSVTISATHPVDSRLFPSNALDRRFSAGNPLVWANRCGRLAAWWLWLWLVAWLLAFGVSEQWLCCWRHQVWRSPLHRLCDTSSPWLAEPASVTGLTKIFGQIFGLKRWSLSRQSRLMTDVDVTAKLGSLSVWTTW